jgi:hypothetical protein
MDEFLVSFPVITAKEVCKLGPCSIICDLLSLDRYRPTRPFSHVVVVSDREAGDASAQSVMRTAGHDS